MILFRTLLISILGGVDACTSSLDCSYNGGCVNGACICYAGWTGTSCSVFSIDTVNLNSFGYIPAGDSTPLSSRGGTVVYDQTSSTYHMWATEVIKSCGNTAWQANSRVVHATASSPSGPYSKTGVVFPALSFDPKVIREPNGLYIMYFSAEVINGNVNSSTTPCDCTTNTTISSNLFAPKFGECTNDAYALDLKTWVSYTTTPNVDSSWAAPSLLADPVDLNYHSLQMSPHIYADGSLRGLYRMIRACHGKPTEACYLIGTVTASDWINPATYTFSSANIFGLGLYEGEVGQVEPDFYIDSNGIYHALFFDERDGLMAISHAFSSDFSIWNNTGTAFDGEILITNGDTKFFSSCRYPSLVRVSGTPKALLAGCALEEVGQNNYGLTELQAAEASGTLALPLKQAMTLSPTNSPSTAPTTSPSNGPSITPTTAPSVSPTLSPSATPTTVPSTSPSAMSSCPTSCPSLSPSTVPSVAPTTSPSLGPSISPSSCPTSCPSLSPSTSPKISSTTAPSLCPSINPTISPSVSPSCCPSLSPTSAPSIAPSISPQSFSPTSSPTSCPSASPTTAPFTFGPSVMPSTTPTKGPSVCPSIAPSFSPTSGTASPSHTPSHSPSSNPSAAPSPSPSSSPSLAPTRDPTSAPTTSPTSTPHSSNPSSVPTAVPTTSPSVSPSSHPSSSPSHAPSCTPNTDPTASPSFAPSFSPSLTPTGEPTSSPVVSSGAPSLSPTTMPSAAPSRMPTSAPSSSPSASPVINTGSPTGSPSSMPSISPSSMSPATQAPQPSSRAPTATLNPSCSPSSSSPSIAPSTSPTLGPSVFSTAGPTSSPQVTLQATAAPTPCLSDDLTSSSISMSIVSGELLFQSLTCTTPNLITDLTNALACAAHTSSSMVSLQKSCGSVLVAYEIRMATTRSTSFATQIQSNWSQAVPRFPHTPTSVNASSRIYDGQTPIAATTTTSSGGDSSSSFMFGISFMIVAAVGWGLVVMILIMVCCCCCCRSSNSSTVQPISDKDEDDGELGNMNIELPSPSFRSNASKTKNSEKPPIKNFFEGRDNSISQDDDDSEQRSATGLSTNTDEGSKRLFFPLSSEADVKNKKGNANENSTSTTIDNKEQKAAAGLYFPDGNKSNEELSHSQNSLLDDRDTKTIGSDNGDRQQHEWQQPQQQLPGVVPARSAEGPDENGNNDDKIATKEEENRNLLDVNKGFAVERTMSSFTRTSYDDVLKQLQDAGLH